MRKAAAVRAPQARPGPPAGAPQFERPQGPGGKDERDGSRFDHCYDRAAAGGRAADRRRTVAKTKSAGAGAAFGAETQSFTARGKAASREAKLQRTTVVLAIVLGVLAIALAIIG